MAVNHVVYDGNTLIDLRNDTVTSAEHIMSGYVGHLADGTVVTGTGQGGGGLETVTIFPSQTVTATDADTSGYVVYLDSITENLVADTNYIVTMDGTSYLCYAHTIYGSIYAGDLEVVWGNPTNAIYPFAIGTYANNRTQWMVADNSPHTVKIERVVSMSGGGGSVTWETMVDQNVTIASSNPNYFVITNYTTPFSADEMYRVTWGSGGTEYICPTKSSEGTSQIYDDYFIGNRVYGGGTDTGEPFAIYRDSATRLVCATNQSAGTWHVKIERQTTTSATLITKTITENGTYSASDDNADGYSEVTVDVPSSGGTQMNIQVAQGINRVNTTSYTAVSGQSLEVAATGTYDVYWTGYRTSTSGTNGSQLYIDSTVYGAAQTTFSNNGQSVKLSGVQLTQGQTVTVRARARTTSYYMYVGNLTIVQTA